MLRPVNFDSFLLAEVGCWLPQALAISRLRNLPGSCCVGSNAPKRTYLIIPVITDIAVFSRLQFKHFATKVGVPVEPPSPENDPDRGYLIVPVIADVGLILLGIPLLALKVGIPVDGDKALPVLRLIVGRAGRSIGHRRHIRGVTIHRIEDDPATITENPASMTMASPTAGMLRVAMPITVAGYVSTMVAAAVVGNAAVAGVTGMTAVAGIDVAATATVATAATAGV
jgi:hypothetical protein